MLLPDDTLAVVLAIGRDSRLLPLTRNRTGPALPFAGNFRVIDFALSNCVNSGVRRILVLTQFRSHSLHKHLRDGWSIFNSELGEFVTAVAPQMRDGSAGYRGTLDALQQTAYLLERNSARYVLVLAGDAIYRMDYAALIGAHRARDAGVTVACRPQAPTDADSGDVDAIDLRSFDTHGVGYDGAGRVWSAIGATVYSRDVLLAALAEFAPSAWDGNDLDAELLPQLAGRTRLAVYPFGGESGRVSRDRYWCRPMDLDAYYRANMRLLESEPPIDLYQRDWPLRTYQAQMPPPRMAPGTSNTEGVCVNSIIANGSVVAGGGVDHSVLFPGVRVHDGAIVVDALVFSGVEVGAGAELRRCIVDKRVVIPPGTRIGVDAAADARRFSLTREGVAVVTAESRFD